MRIRISDVRECLISHMANGVLRSYPLDEFIQYVSTELYPAVINKGGEFLQPAFFDRYEVDGTMVNLYIRTESNGPANLGISVNSADAIGLPEPE